jgi:hypothetical protein
MSEQSGTMAKRKVFSAPAAQEVGKNIHSFMLAGVMFER